MGALQTISNGSSVLEDLTVLCPKAKSPLKITSLLCIQRRFRSRQFGSNYEHWRCLSCVVGQEAENKVKMPNEQYDLCECGGPKRVGLQSCGADCPKRVENPTEVKVTLKNKGSAINPEKYPFDADWVDATDFEHLPFSIRWTCLDKLECDCGKHYHPFRFGGLPYAIQKLCPCCFWEKKQRAAEAGHEAAKERRRQEKEAAKSLSAIPDIKAEVQEVVEPPQLEVPPTQVVQEPVPQPIHETETQKEVVEEATIVLKLHPGPNHITLDFGEYPEMLEQLRAIAKKQFRTLDNQILFFLFQTMGGEGK